MRHLVLHVAIPVLVTASGLLAYDRVVVRPAQIIGVVDVDEIFRLKEAEFASLLTASKTEEESHRSMELASAFARRMPLALEELPAACRCLVVLKSAIAGRTPNTVDLTGLLKTKLELR